MIKAVLFDCDGTIFDTSFQIFVGYKHLFDKYRPDYKPTAEEYYSFLGPSLAQMFPKYFDEDLDILIEEYRQAGYKYMDKEHIPVYPNFIECLKELKKLNIKTAIVSSRVHFGVENLLKLHNIQDLFDVIVGCDDITNHKPDPEPFIYCLNKLNLNSDEAVMVGDHYGDIKGASNANMKSIVVDWSAYGAEKLLKEGAISIMKDYKDLVEIIKGIK